MTSSISPIILAFLSSSFGPLFPNYNFENPLRINAAYSREVAILEHSVGLPVSGQRNVPVMRLKPDADPPPVHTATSLLLVDATQGSVLYSDHADIVVPLASLTKLATVITFLELHVPETNRVVITTSDVIDTRSSLMEGDEVSVRDLIGLTLVGSSNSAAKALVTASGLSSEYFVGRMNRLARELGLTNTRFVEPTGLNAGNAGTALDVYHLLEASGRYFDVRTLAQKDSYTFWNGREEKKMNTTDGLVAGLVPFRGLEIVVAKTGFIPESGYHVALIARDENGNNRIAIVLGAAETLGRFKEADDLLHWGAMNFVR